MRLFSIKSGLTLFFHSICISWKHFSITRGTTLDGFSGQFFHNFEIVIFCFVVAISDLDDVEAMHSLC